MLCSEYEELAALRSYILYKNNSNSNIKCVYVCCSASQSNPFLKRYYFSRHQIIICWCDSGMAKEHISSVHTLILWNVCIYDGTEYHIYTHTVHMKEIVLNYAFHFYFICFQLKIPLLNAAQTKNTHEKFNGNKIGQQPVSITEKKHIYILN